MAVRKAHFAGSWYPGNASDCRKTIEEFIDAGLPCPTDIQQALGGIVPHAGWVFSGRIACNVIKCLSDQTHPETMLIFGHHLHSGSDNLIMKEGRWATPLGELEIDADLASKLMEEFDFVVDTPERHQHDNTIELQLPLIKYFFPQCKIVPMGLPPNAATLEIALRAAEICKTMGRKTMVLGSTDLTHYGHNYGFTPRGVGVDAVEWVKNSNDRRVVELMLRLDGEGVIREALKNHNACCAGAVGAAIVAAKTLGARKAEEILYATSYDIRPDSSFVGYVGVLLGR